MLNTIILGLSALSSVTGVQSSETYAFQNGDQLPQTYELRNLAQQSSENNMTEIYSMKGENRYVLVQDNQSRVLYDKATNAICEVFSEGNNPYQGRENMFNVYNPTESLGFKYLSYENDSFFDLSKNRTVDFDGVRDYFNGMQKTAGEYEHIDTLPAAAHKIANSFYFMRLDNRHAWNSEGTCTIVALEMLLGYYDTFASDLFVDDVYDQITRERIGGETVDIQNFVHSPGVDDLSVDAHSFHDYLCDIATNEVKDNPRVGGMSESSQIKLTNNYLDKRNISRNLHTSIGNLADYISGRAKTKIREAIDNNRPVIANGKNHSTVAFAYDDQYVYLHTGWGWVAKTTWSTYEGTMIDNDFLGAIDIEYTGQHVHSDNYQSLSHNKFICPCGKLHTTTTITPEDFGFEPQYFFYSKQKLIELENLTVNTNRMRAGYIENEYTNLSAKRKNAGEAYLVFTFDKMARKFEIDLSYWQIKDKLSAMDSSIQLFVMKPNNSWQFAKDFLSADTQLSTDRTQQDSFTFNYVGDEIKGIKLVVSSPATGDSNGGRVSIGNVVIMHE